MMDDMSRYLDLFKEEAGEILQTINDQLLALEQGSGDKQVVEELFRALHSLKGITATMGFDQIADLSHKMESLIDQVRNERIEITTALMNILFEATDTLQVLLSQVDSENPVNEIDIKSLVAKLEKASKGDLVSSDRENKKKPGKKLEDSRKKNQIEFAKSSQKNTVRVKLEYLDKLMDLVGELVITKARLDQLENNYRIPELAEPLDQIKTILGDLQHGVMKIRMIPVGQVFNRFSRMIRDTAQELGKEVDYVLEGSEIELDRAILDEIGDPIVHLLRNAVGHGIESPEEREKKGKPRMGTIRLIARREKEGAVIEVQDDGKGINPDRIREIAVKNGFISKQEADTLEDEEIIQLIYLPGFTSADKTTSLCGRGVGVDAVQAKVLSLGGTLAIKSEPDRGAQFIMRLPPSLAIVKALLVKLGSVTYAIPLKNIAEVVKVQKDELRSIDEKDMMVNHGGLIELIRSSHLFGGASNGESQENELYVVILELDNKIKGLVVDTVMSQKDVVIKPLTPALQGVAGLGGMTILGDGKVALILEVRSIFISAGRRRRINESAGIK